MRPILLFDGNCSFCRMWVDFWRSLTADEVEYRPFQAANARDTPRDAVELVQGGSRYRAAHAVFLLLSRVPGYSWMLWAYHRVPGFAALAEWIYTLIPARRNLAYRVTRMLWGERVEVPTYRTAAAVFAPALAIIYLIAFVSFGLQVQGLIGSRGILPAADYFEAFGPSSFRRVPTLFWWAHSDLALSTCCWAGAALAIAAALSKASGLIQRTAFAGLFVLYLSLVTAGQIFMGYQWDFLLLEAGFLAIFLTSALPRVWLFQWLLFRLIFESGAVKLQSHDPTWKGLTALSYHYETQPLPTPLAWHMQQAPLWFQKTSTALVLGVELLIPFLIFGPRRMKQAGALGMIGLQVLILLTGNYTYFNWLSIALCLFLLDDTFFRKRRVPTAAKIPRANRVVSAALLAFVTGLGGSQLAEMFGSTPPALLRDLEARIAPFGLINGYGLFASMTATRPEILIEGSNDGANWTPYPFRYKAGPLNRGPAWVAPYQPRLDWQMWFGALGSYPQNPWFVQLCLRLLQGSKPVLGLLERDPFEGKPPKYIRALLYEYHFSDPATRSKTGNWWTRELKGSYFPAVSLKSMQ